jgi:hypothetical protein
LQAIFLNKQLKLLTERFLAMVLSLAGDVSGNPIDV